MPENQNKIFWKIQLTTGFKDGFKTITDETDIWRVKGFIRNIPYIKDPTIIYNTTECEDCPPSVVLFGLSNDGLGNKGIEIQVWLNSELKTLHFLKCRKATKPKTN